MIAFLAATLAVAASASPAHAQQKAPLIGFLSASKESGGHSAWYAAFRDKMRGLGYVEGRTIRYAYRFANGKRDRLPALVSELVRLDPSVLVTTGTPASRAAKAATSTIPIVMSVGYPVRAGLVRSIARPGGNITGMTVLPGPEFYGKLPGPEFYGKRLEILMEAAPSLSHIAVLLIRNHHAHALSLRTLEEVAEKTGVTILPLPVAKPEDVTGALETIRRERADAFLIMGSPLFGSRIKQMAAFALNKRLPFMCTSPWQVRQGCLIAYGVNNFALYRRLTGYVDKILNGASPAEMPVEQPTEYDLAVNLKTARAIGINVPPSILLRATEVIE
jgi:putative ABC transport system substrate-binding protein